MSKSRASTEGLKRFAMKVAGGKYDEAAIDFILSPNWEKSFQEALKKKVTNEKVEKLESILNKTNKSRLKNATVATIVSDRSESRKNNG